MRLAHLALAKPYEWLWRRRYRRRFGRWPSLSRPRSFNERMAAQLYRVRDRRWVDLADKLKVKDWVAAQVGPGWVVPTLFSGPRLPALEQRDWPLPFTIKPNNAAGCIRHLLTPADADWPAIEEQCRNWMAGHHGLHYGEWHYDEMPSRILVEPHMLGPGGETIRVYRLWCFSGMVKYVQVAMPDGDELLAGIFDLEWRRQPWSYHRRPHPRDPPPPTCLDEMVAGAAVLTRDFEFVRLDLYDDHGQPKLGEMTFTSTYALGKFNPPEWNERIGEVWGEALARRAAEAAG